MKKTKEVAKPEPVEVSDVPDWSTVKGLSSKIQEVTLRMIEIQHEKKELEEEEADLKALGSELLIKAKVKSVSVQGHKATRVDGEKKTVDVRLLLAEGVPQKKIDAATKTTPWTSFRVTEKKAEAGGGE